MSKNKLGCLVLTMRQDHTHLGKPSDDDVILEIGGRIIGTIRVTSVREDKARVSFRFDEDVLINRRPLHERKRAAEASRT